MKQKREDDSFDSDDQLDETLEATFPGSDAPANTVVTGIGGVPRQRSADGKRLAPNRAP